MEKEKKEKVAQRRGVVCFGTYTEGTKHFAKDMRDKAIEAGRKDAKILNDGAWIRVLDGEPADFATAQNTADEINAEGTIRAYVLELETIKN